jgi:phage-related protein
MRQVVFYKTPAGRCPIEEFLESLIDVQAEASYQIIRLIAEEERVGTQFLRKLTKDIWELRVRAGAQQIRYLCFFDGRTLVVLTNGFVKKTRKTPQREIDLAGRRRSDYLRRR